MLAGTDIGGVFISEDSGAHWSAANNGLTASCVRALAAVNGTIFAGTPGGLFASTDEGSSWKPANNGLENTEVYALAVIDTALLVGTFDGIFRTSHADTAWQSIRSGLGGVFIWSLASSGQYLFAGSVTTGLYRSTNGGGYWNPFADYPTASIECLAAAGQNVFAGVSGVGTIRSTDYGQHWQNVGTIPEAHCLMVNGGAVFSGKLGTGVSISWDNGGHWSGFSDSLTDAFVYSFGANGRYVFAGTWGGIWRRAMGLVPLREKGNGVPPGHFSLDGNYPNPFNPSTTIRYTLPVSSHVRLIIYDVLGREVARLIDFLEGRGEHDAVFDGAGVRSGIYFYRLTAGGFSATGRMTLLR